MYYSQFEQDKYLNENIFKNKSNGVFVDVGAYDGIVASNTYFFEKELGWNGICIEPNLESYNKLVKNRNCINLNVCAYSENIEVMFLELCGRGLDIFSGLNECYDKRHFDYVSGEINKKIYENNNDYNIKVKPIKARTLTSILSEYGYNKIDFCCIDTEGSELNVLRGIDFSVFDINVIILENNFFHLDYASKCGDYLKELNYDFVTRLNIDEVYIKKYE